MMKKEIKYGKVPLERALSKLGIASRSQTRKLIDQGSVSVDGQVIRDQRFLVTPETADIKVDGRAVGKAAERTIMVNKPRGFVTTKSDEKGRKTVFDLLPPQLQHLHPVGRLDMATTGLLLMTTDTQLSNYLTDPVNAIPRTYLVTVEGKVAPQKIALLLKGIMDDGELLKPSKVLLRKDSNKESHLTMELCEGKNREIRRMFKAIGHEVTHLKRIAFGSLGLGDLQSGEIADVAQAVAQHFKKQGHPRP